MSQNRHFNLLSFLVAILILASCAVISHPNEKIIVGIWKPVKVEKIVDSAALKAAVAQGAASGQKQGKAGVPAAEGGVSRQEASLDRLAQSELRTTMEIFSNKTALKNYPGKPLRATWKMKGDGTRIVAKNVETKSKVVLEILEISKVQIVVLEHAHMGDLKITYERQE
ncbi:MAG: hypothetical protein ACOYNC_11115 [Bacteroidales bacterium]